MSNRPIDSQYSPGNILLLWDRMGDYHRARWRALQRASNDTVFAADLFDSDNLYKWESTENTQTYICLSGDNSKFSVLRLFFVRLRHFERFLKNKDISTVFIPGYQHFIYILFVIIAKAHGCRVVMFAESWYRSYRILELLKSSFLRLFVDAFFVSGLRAKHHFYHHLKISPKKISEAYSVVDNSHFAHSTFSSQQNKPILLCVARYAQEKNLESLIHAFVSSKLYESWLLVLLGDGPQKAYLESLVNTHNNIELTGWKHYNELPQYYSEASCFVLPSVFEPWGLAVNEAMAAGLPIIISEECGCAPDLFSDKNGWIFRAHDRHSLIEVLDVLHGTSIAELTEMGAVSKSIIDKYSVEVWAETALRLHKS